MAQSVNSFLCFSVSLKHLTNEAESVKSPLKAKQFLLRDLLTLFQSSFSLLFRETLETCCNPMELSRLLTIWQMILTPSLIQVVFRSRT